jgi:ribosome modulation factor
MNIDDLIYAYHEGYLARRSGKSCPYPDPVLAKEWKEGLDRAVADSSVRVVMPVRPEGYYHSSLTGE